MHDGSQGPQFLANSISAADNKDSVLHSLFDILQNVLHEIVNNTSLDGMMKSTNEMIHVMDESIQHSLARWVFLT